MSDESRLIEEGIASLEAKHQPLARATACFGVLWEDEEGVCPETTCLLRKGCESTFKKVESIKVDFVAVEALVRQKPATYERVAYVSLGRLVDEYIRLFVHGLNYPKYLPIPWSYHKMKKGEYSADRVLIVPRASYHGVFVDSVLVCRFWTNAAGFAIVDLSTALSNYLAGLGKEVAKIPDKSLTKAKPCTHRIYCNSEEDAQLLAAAIKAVYNIKDE